MDKLNIELLILISNNLIIKDIIKLFTINKKFESLFKKNYKIFSNNYFPMYHKVKNYNDFNDLININFNNILYINKNKLCNYIKKIIGHLIFLNINILIKIIKKIIIFII